MNVRSMCAVFGAPHARAAGGRRGLAALAGAIFALAVGAAHAQADASRTSAILRNDGPVLGIVYEDTFGRRLANAVGLLFNHESALKNVPVPAYPMGLVQDNICGNEGGAPGGDIGEKIAIVRAAGLQEEADQYIGWMFAPVEPGATVKLPDLCNWLNEPDVPSETWKPDWDGWYLLTPRLLPLRDPKRTGSFIMTDLFIERAAFSDSTRPRP